MRTNIEIDDTLMKDAMVALGVTTKREAVEESLRRAVRAKRQLEAIEQLRGTGWNGDEDEVRRNRYTVQA